LLLKKIPALVAEVRSLRAEVEQLTGERDAANAIAVKWRDRLAAEMAEVERLRAASSQPTTFDLTAHLQRQCEFSARTFGPGLRTLGVSEHIVKELAEIAADPTDAHEWIDVVILGLDGAWRAGLTPQQIISGLVAKQTKNEARTWPDWRTQSEDKAIEHDRSADAASTSPAEPTKE
jgi:hypothetical protein